MSAIIVFMADVLSAIFTSKALKAEEESRNRS